mgnify:CR=1 FL=1
MEIKKEVNGNKAVIGLTGRLDTTTSPQLEAELNELFETVNDIVFDFNGLEYISSAGLRVLLMSQKTMNKKSGEMVIVNACQEIKEILDITGFSDVLNIK